MLISLLTLLIISNALTLRKDQSILFSRVVMVSLIHTSFLAYNNLFFLALDKGIGIFGGLFHVTVFTQIFNIFIFLISALILTLTSFYPRKVKKLDKIFSISSLTILPLITGGLIFFSFRLPFKLMLTALGLEQYYFIVSSFSAILFATVLCLLKEGEMLKGAKLIAIGVSSLIVTIIFSFISQDISYIVYGFFSFSFTYFSFPLISDGYTLFSSSNGDTSTLRGSEQQSNNFNEIPPNFNYKLFAQAFEEKAEVILLERELGLNTDKVRDKSVTLLDLGIGEDSPYYPVLTRFAIEYKGNRSEVRRFCTSILTQRAIRVKIYDKSTHIGSKIFDAISNHK